MLQVDNGIGDRGAEMIGEGLKVNRKLLELYLVRRLDDCFVLFSPAIDGEGWDGVGCIYRSCFADVHVRLLLALTRVLQDGNGIGDRGAEMIGEGLKGVPRNEPPTTPVASPDC